jgi:GT2 family glycosyltransferase/glycosyltransferase involved in cell wall biosynthesis
MTRPDVSVLLVSWNTRVQTRRCLDSLPDAAQGLSYEVIVVDNGSRDGSPEMLGAYPGLVLIHNDRNLGFAAAANQAYAHSSGEMVLLLNSDITLRTRALTTLATFLRERPKAAGVAPLYLNPDGSIQQHYMRLPTFRSVLALATAVRYLPGFRRSWREHLMRGEDFSRPRPVEQPSVSCLLLRRSALPSERVFDERFPLYFNDVLLARTLARAGHHLWMTPEAVVTHTLGASTSLLGPAVRTMYRLAGLIDYARLTQPRGRVRVLQALVLLDRLTRRALRLRGQLGIGDLWTVLRGDIGPLPDGDRSGWTVMVSGVPWSAGAHRQHALARELASGRRVLYVDPPGLRPRWRLSIHPITGSLWHAVPPTALPFGRLLPPANRVNRRIAAALLRRWLDGHPGSRLLWIDEDLAAPVAGRLGEDAVVYDAADLDWTFTRSWNRPHLRSGIREAVAAADLVLASSPALPQWLPASRRPPVIVPNGCDPAHFSMQGTRARQGTRLPAPRLVYAGAIDTRAFDSELIAAVARRHPEWTFLLVGPSSRAGRAPLAGLANVHLTGPVDFDDVPALLRACDACLIPYRVGGLIDYVHPKKLYEYLAVGKPVVATPLPALTSLTDLVYLGSGPDGFAKAIADALDSHACPDAMARRRAVAVRNSWSVRGEQVRSLLEQLEMTRR